MFNIGIIGCGKIAQVRHIPEYAAHPAARLAGYYDLNQERAQALAEQIRSAFHPGEVLIADLGPIIGAHTGPSIVAILYFGKKRES